MSPLKLAPHLARGKPSLLKLVGSAGRARTLIHQLKAHTDLTEQRQKCGNARARQRRADEQQRQRSLKLPPNKAHNHRMGVLHSKRRHQE